MPGQVEHRLILHDLAGRHQDAQDNPAFSSIHDIMGLVAQVRPAAFETQWRGIRIGGADANVGRAQVAAMHLSPLPAVLGDPVMPRDIGLGQGLPLRFGQSGTGSGAGVSGSSRLVGGDVHD